MVVVYSFVSRVPLGASTRSFDSFDLRGCYTMHSALLTRALRCSLVRGLVSVWPSVRVGLCWPLAFLLLLAFLKSIGASMHGLRLL